MKINWKLRFKNKTVLLSLFGVAITFVYQILSIIGIAVPISEDNISQIVALFINILVAIGVIVDPTTEGISDSERAMSYNIPR